MFFQGSRYEDVDTVQITDATGRVIPYIKVRFIPPTPAVVGHSVTQGERLDQIERGRIGPMQVLEDLDDRLRARACQNPRRYRG